MILRNKLIDCKVRAQNLGIGLLWYEKSYDIRFDVRHFVRII